MAFIQSVSLPATSAPTNAATCVRPRQVTATMDVPNYSRRAVLRLVAGALAVAGGSAAHAARKKDEDEFDMKELKKDVEDLKYDSEVTEIGPDTREKNPTRTKKPQAAPKYKDEEKRILENEGAAYKSMVNKELSESEKLKKEFENRKK